MSQLGNQRTLYAEPFLSLVISPLVGSLKKVVSIAIDALGKIDILVNNAGRRHAGTILETPLAEVREVFELNTFSVMAMTAAVARNMAQQDGGSIINILSRLAYSGVPTLSTYSASKGALDSYTRSAAVELAPHNIRVNAVAPGMAKTPLIEDWLADQPNPSKALADTVSEVPLGRLASPADVASAVAYLASPEVAYITGTSLSVDGGVSRSLAWFLWVF